MAEIAGTLADIPGFTALTLRVVKFRQQYLVKVTEKITVNFLSNEHVSHDLQDIQDIQDAAVFF